MKLQGFSYSKLTELQVQGARERSSRQIELSQLASRLDHLKQALVSSSPHFGKEVFVQAVRKAFEDRDLSPIMVERLVTLCRHEYRVTEVERALQTSKNHKKSDIEWIKNEIVKAKADKTEVTRDFQRQVRVQRIELEKDRLSKLNDQRALLTVRKMELMRLRDEKRQDDLLQRERLIQEQLEQEQEQQLQQERQQQQQIRELAKEQELDDDFEDDILDDDDTDSHDDVSVQKAPAPGWIELEDDYFSTKTTNSNGSAGGGAASGGGSEWVLCS